MNPPIYLDYNATTPVDPRVLDAMMPYFTAHFGNAASRNHAFGWEAEEAVETARVQIARALGAKVRRDDKNREYTQEIIFTSGATESNNIAILGAAHMYADKGKHLITGTIEHKAVLDPCKVLEKEGFEVSYLAPDGFGRVSAEAVEAALRPDTILVSLMAANNEIGSYNPIGEIGALCHRKGVIFHTDAAQAFGRLELDVEKQQLDVVSLSGHKIYGPKGIGALYVRRKNPRVRLAPVIHGGGHERGLRSGTLNVPAIVGMGQAAEICVKERQAENQRLEKLRRKLHQGIVARLDQVILNGHPTERLPGNLNLSFAYVEGEALMMGMRGIAVSSGSACTSASLEPSYVLRGIGVGDDLAHSSIRFGLGRFTTEEEVERTIEEVVQAVTRLREMSPLYEMAREGIDLSTVKWSAH